MIISARAPTAIVVLCLCCGLRGQEPQPGTGPAHPVADTADRIARQLWPVDAFTSTGDGSGAHFRVDVTAPTFALPLPWLSTRDPTARIRGRGTQTHRQFLYDATPEAFRASTLYPIGITVDPGEILHGVKARWRDWQARRIHERVEREVAQLRAQTQGRPSSALELSEAAARRRRPRRRPPRRDPGRHRRGASRRPRPA
jgi:hypothetical protein